MQASYAKVKDSSGNDIGWGLWVKMKEGEQSPNEGDIIPVKTKSGEVKKEKVFEKLTSFDLKDEPGFRLEKWSKWETDRSGKFIKAPERQFAPPEEGIGEEESPKYAGVDFGKFRSSSVKNASKLEDDFQAASGRDEECPF